MRLNLICRMTVIKIGNFGLSLEFNVGDIECGLKYGTNYAI